MFINDVCGLKGGGLRFQTLIKFVFFFDNYISKNLVTVNFDSNLYIELYVFRIFKVKFAELWFLKHKDRGRESGSQKIRKITDVFNNHPIFSTEIDYQLQQISNFIKYFFKQYSNSPHSILIFLFSTHDSFQNWSETFAVQIPHIV